MAPVADLEESMKTPETLARRADPVSPEIVAGRVARVLAESGLTPEQSVEVLGAAFVTEAFRPYWIEGRPANEAHDRMRRHDPELAEAVEALSPMLLGRVRSREEAASALAEIERLLAR
jgi:hypothetical protein